MRSEEFDRCPDCGSSGVYGLRCHPKYSVKVGIVVEETIHGKVYNMPAYYAHYLPEFKALVSILSAHPDVDIISTEHWDGSWWREIVL